MTVGDSPVTKEYAAHSKYVIDMSNSFTVNGLCHLTDAIHRYGALASIELNLRDEPKLPGDYSDADLQYVVDSFSTAARHAKMAGFDMVMVHAGHGHALANFMSPSMNHRTDEYGSDTLENRTRFVCRVLDAVRAEIGPQMPIELRISGDELIEGGVGAAESLENAKVPQKKVDMIHVSAGSLYAPPGDSSDDPAYCGPVSGLSS